MAKKKGKKGKGKKSSGKGINTTKLLGMAGGVFADKKFLDTFLGKYITDKKIKAVAKIAIGEFAPKQDFIRNLLKNDAALIGGGDALSVHGMDDLFAEMGIAGMGADDTELAVAIEGDDDSEMDKDIDAVDGDIDTVGEDDDDMGEEVLGEDVLGEDDDED